LFLTFYSTASYKAVKELVTRFLLTSSGTEKFSVLSLDRLESSLEEAQLDFSKGRTGLELEDVPST
jgi:hypothetical protein